MVLREERHTQQDLQLFSMCLEVRAEMAILLRLLLQVVELEELELLEIWQQLMVQMGQQDLALH
ncbi:hypothetical protein D3C87_1750680 [compost metagenome]